MPNMSRYAYISQLMKQYVTKVPDV